MQFHVLSFEGPDPYSRAGGLATRVEGLSETLAGLGFETHLWFIGDPDLPGHERRGTLHLHRWAQWVSRHHRGGVYDGEWGKCSELATTLPPHLLREMLLPYLEAGRAGGGSRGGVADRRCRGASARAARASGQARGRGHSLERQQHLRIRADRLGPAFQGGGDHDRESLHEAAHARVRSGSAGDPERARGGCLRTAGPVGVRGVQTPLPRPHGRHQDGALGPRQVLAGHGRDRRRDEARGLAAAPDRARWLGAPRRQRCSRPWKRMACTGWTANATSPAHAACSRRCGRSTAPTS